MTPPWIRTPEALAELARSLEGCRTIGLDTESDSLYHHFEKVCLVQLATDRGDAWLVDALAVRDLSPLAPVLLDPGVVKVLHGADYDVTTLKRDFGFAFASIFDTMIAARLLGRSEIGLAAVARDELGVTLTKTNQKDDWSRRPLTPQQEAYALADVLHLVELRDRLEAKLVAAGRLDWMREECEAVAALEAVVRKREPRGLPRDQGGEAPPAARPRGAARAPRLARAAGGGDGHAPLQDPRQRVADAPRRAPAEGRGGAAGGARRPAPAPAARGRPARRGAPGGGARRRPSCRGSSARRGPSCRTPSCTGSSG